MQYNIQTEQRVWERVMGNPRQEQSQPEQERLSAEQLKRLAEKEMESACLYRSLCARVCPRCQHILSEIAAQETCHAKHLAAVYFVLTGQKLCLQPAARPCITCTAEELRRAYLEEKAAAETYAALAAAGGDHGHLLQCMARDEKNHAKKLLCVIGDSV